MLKKIVAATTLAVTVDRAKQRLRIDADEFDADIEAMLWAAQAATETRCNITLAESSWEYRVGRWADFSPLLQPERWTLDRGLTPPYPLLQIPTFPVRDVTAITYLDADDAEQTVDPAMWTWERSNEGADILFSRNFTLPLLSARPQAVRVSFTAGFDPSGFDGSGADPQLALPPQAEMAILFLVGHWHRNHDPVGTDALYPVPNTFDFLAEQLRIYR